MSITVSRRRWLLSAAAVTLGSATVSAQSPGGGPRIASSTAMMLPSRSIRLGGPDVGRTVVTAIAVDPRGELVAAAGDDFKIYILRISNLSTAETLKGHHDIIRTLAFDASGSRLVSAGNDGQLILWDRDESFHVRQKMQGAPALFCVRFSPDGGEMAAVGFDDSVFLIGRRRQPAHRFQRERADLRAVAYRDDNQLLAVAGRGGNLHLLTTDDGRLLSSHPLHESRISDLTFHRQAHLAVCVAEDGCVSVFDTQQRNLVRRIPVTSGKLFAVAVINSHLVAVAGSDNVIRVVNTDDGSVLRRLEGHAGSVSTLAASGGVLFSGSYDATLRRWSVSQIDDSQSRIAEMDPRIDR